MVPPHGDETLVLVGARVRTLDPAGATVDAIALRDGRIAAVGPSAAARATEPDATVVDLGGRTVLPGLIDAHSHLEGTALHLAHYAD